jgi:hypothetical protein
VPANRKARRGLEARQREERRHIQRRELPGERGVVVVAALDHQAVTGVGANRLAQLPRQLAQMLAGDDQ